MSSESNNIALTKSAKVSELLMSVLEGDQNVLELLGRIWKYDFYTAQHSVRVFGYAVRLGIELGLDEDEIRDIGIAALLHDYGKTCIDINIINKAGKLTEEEYLKVQQHVLFSYSILSRLEFNKRVLRYVLEHHERDDGKGYPLGKRAGDISVGGRIIGLADKFDAVTVKRIYQERSMSKPEALDMLWDEPGLDYMFIAKLSNIV